LNLPKHLLWIDCIGAAVVGVAVLLLSGWLSELEGLPRNVILFTGIVNLLYGSFSFSLAIRARRPMRLINALVWANLAWMPVCVGLVVAYWPTITVFGMMHLLGEGAYVGGLALLEWRYRDLLVTAPTSSHVAPADASR
jgi:hypothetical protein